MCKQQQKFPETNQSGAQTDFVQLNNGCLRHSQIPSLRVNVSTSTCCSSSHHMAECHHTQQRLTTGLDGCQWKRPNQLLEKTQNVKCSGVLFSA